MSFIRFLAAVSENKTKKLVLTGIRSDVYGSIEEGQLQDLLDSAQFPCLEELHIRSNLFFNPAMRPFIQRMLSNNTLRHFEMNNDDMPAAAWSDFLPLIRCPASLRVVKLEGAIHLPSAMEFCSRHQGLVNVVINSTARHQLIPQEIVPTVL